MQLYVSVYQQPDIWKDCWTFLLPVMNTQLVWDIENFKLARPAMDVEAFMYSLQNLA